MLILLGILSSCESFLDVNEHPNKQTIPSLTTLTTSCIERATNMNYLLTYYANRYTQHTSSVSGSSTDQFYENRMSTAWSNLYIGLLSDLNELKILATEKKASHFLGLAQVLNAAYLGAASDFWGDIPYSESFKGNENFTPAFDTQTEIYEEVYRLLETGIENLKKTETNFSFIEENFDGSFDILYQANNEAWIKMAYAFKARFLNHWSKTSSFDAEEVKTAIENSFSSYTEDADIFYNDVDRSPYYGIILDNNTGNLSITFADYFIQILNGNIYDKEIDPRLAIIADTTVLEHNGVFTGHQSGSGDSNPETDLFFTDNCWHFGQLAANQMMTYSEMQFILAEVEINNGNKTNAFMAYERALRANMQKLGVDDVDIEAYIVDTEVTDANITIENVMKEKYIAMFLQYEAWNDIRRYDYGVGNETYKNFELPVDVNPELNGEFIRRVLYPMSEKQRNGENVTAAEGGNYGLIKRVTWDE